MAKILHEGNWYYPVDSKSVYEINYEKRILSHSKLLFPGFFCMQFKKSVESIYGVAIPDLVLIDEKYREWIIVEVELEHHPLRNDVEDQIIKFAAGSYTKEHAEYLFNKNKDLDLDKLKTLVTSMQPRISVMVPSVKPSWANALSRYNASIAVIEMWEDYRGNYLLRINGQQPIVSKPTFLTNIKRARITNNELEVENPSVLPDTDQLKILIDSYVSDWKIIKTSTKAWLFPKRDMPLNKLSGLSFILSRNEVGEYILENSNVSA